MLERPPVRAELKLHVYLGRLTTGAMDLLLPVQRQCAQQREGKKKKKTR